jgi:hypothetical protein
MKIENLLNAVNIGKFNDLVEPKPKITLHRNISEIGKISLHIANETYGTSIFLRNIKDDNITVVTRN